MSAHTPGPWFANAAIGTDDADCGWHIEPECIDFQYRGMVCSLNDAEHIEGITKSERDANARLIAAAPELLALLKDWREACGSMVHDELADKPRQTTHELRDAVVFGGAVRWTFWRCVKPREVPAKERRSEPRASRFDNLMETTK
jgi:hypothetical protein